MSEKNFTTTHWPVEIRVRKQEKTLDIDFDNGVSFSLPMEYLRVESPSAEVQGHGPGDRVLVPGRAEVGILELEPIGNYAVRILFDDLHDTGIYSWRFLYELGEQYETRWATYLAALDAAGKSRFPVRRG